MLKLAVIGAGHLGRIHARLASQTAGVELIGVVDPDDQARKKTSLDCGVKTFARCEDLSPELDAAIVAAPTTLHHAVTMDLLHRGIHVLVEKPLAPTVAEAAAMVETARHEKLVLQVGHVERFNPVMRDVRPHIGVPKFIDALRVGPFSFRSTDIGVVLDLMIHDIDLVLSLVDSPLRSVEALGVSVLGGHEDMANARLVFASGCVANLSASRVSYEASRRMWLVSDRGFASVDFAGHQATLVGVGDRLREQSVGAETLPLADQQKIKEQFFETLLPKQSSQVQQTNAIAEEIVDFVESIHQLRSPRVSGEQGLAAIQVAEQILDRMQTHQWDGSDLGRIGPQMTPGTPILRPGNWPQPDSDLPTPRREAG